MMHNIDLLSYFFFQDTEHMKKISRAFHKSDVNALTVDWCVFGRFGALQMGFHHHYACCFDSGVQWWIHVSLAIIIQRNKYFGIRLNMSKHVSKVRMRSRFRSNVSKRGSRFAVSFFIFKSLCKIKTIEAYGISVSFNLRTLAFGSAITVTWIFPIICSVTSFFVRPGGLTVFVLLPPHLKSEINFHPCFSMEQIFHSVYQVEFWFPRYFFL